MAELLNKKPTNLTEYPNSFERQGAFPLDANSIYYSYDDAVTYATTNKLAYVGQTIVVVENSVVTLYVIQPDSTLKEVGSGLSDEDINNIKSEIIGGTDSSSPQDNTILGAKAYADKVVNNLTINWNAVVASQLQGSGETEFTKFSIASMNIVTGSGLLTLITENHSVYSFIIYCNLVNGTYNYKIHQLYSKCDAVDDCLITKINIPLDSTKNRTHICLSVQSNTSMINTAYRMHCSYTSLSNNLLDLKPINELTLPYSETLFSGDQGSPSFTLWESDGTTPYNGAIYHIEFSNDTFDCHIQRNAIGNTGDYFRGKSQYAERDADGKTISTTYLEKDAAVGAKGIGTGAEIFNDYTNNTATGNYAHAEGYMTKAYGADSHAEGSNTTASGPYSHAEGYKTNALFNQHVQGHYNNINTTTETSIDGGTSGTAFVIGNGTSASASNAFRVNYDGKVYGSQSAIITGADYAEYFEWEDGNLNNEDRRGYFVTISDEKIKIAESNDYILGIVSGQPSVIGNGDEDWKGRYILDEFGSRITETYEYEEEVIDEEGNIITIIKTGTKFKENPDYDPTRPYIQRADRSEWDAVGMMGVLAVRDDGTCKVNGFCAVTNNGIATASDTGYRVIARITDNIIKVILK